MKLLSKYLFSALVLVFFSTSLWSERNYEKNLTDADISSIQTDRWMQELWGYLHDKKLSEIALSGSHDSGMNHDDIGNCLALQGKHSTETQYGNISYQLNKGTRYIDIRPALLEPSKYNGTRWVTNHADPDPYMHMVVGCEGESLESIREGLHEFFLDSAHKDELVILKISHCGKTPASHQNNYNCSTEELKHIASSLDIDEKIISFNATPEYNLKTMTLEQILEKGNILLLVDGYGEPKKGIFYVSGNEDDCSKDYFLYDNYANMNDYDDMKTDQLKKLKDYDNQKISCNGNEYKKNFLLSWTLTLTQNQAIVGHPSIMDLAATATPKLEGVIKDWIDDNTITKTYFPNILYIDAVNSEATRSAIRLNIHYDDLDD